MSNKSDFTGKVVLITGSSSGVGALTAVEFARLGAQVVVTGRDGQRVSDVAKQCREVSPKCIKPLEVLADITISEDCRRLIATTIDTFTRLDVLVNSAGNRYLKRLLDVDVMDTFGHCLDKNLRPVVLLTHLCAQHLVKTSGNIINISSVASMIPRPRSFAYCMARCALNMFTKCVALELAHNGVRVNTIVSGVFQKTLLDGMDGMDSVQSEAIYAKLALTLPMGRVGQRIDIVNVVLHMASPEAEFITGNLFVIDGGKCCT